MAFPGVDPGTRPDPGGPFLSSARGTSIPSSVDETNAWVWPLECPLFAWLPLLLLGAHFPSVPSGPLKAFFSFGRRKILLFLAVIFIPAEGFQGHLNVMALFQGLPFLH